MRKKKILMVHNYYRIPGGEDTVVANEKKLLEENGHRVFLYSRNNSELKNFSKLQKLVLPFTTIFNLRTYREVRKIIKDKKIDIVHVHNTLNLVSPSVYYAAKSMRVPVVQTVHNFRFLCPGATFYRDGHICEDCVIQGLGCAVKHKCYRGSKIQTLACVISTQIHRCLGIYGKINYICLTDFNKEKLLQLKQIQTDKVFVKPNFVEISSKVVPYEKRLERYAFVGRLDPLKGIDILFNAWKNMGVTAPKLIVCGIGPLDSWCQNFLSENPDCNIELKGLVPNEEVKKIIANSRALILPTQWYEGFPMSILEAYSVGTPVIGSDIGNVGSIIEDGITGIKFKHDSEEKLVECIREFGNYHKELPEKTRMKFSGRTNYQILLDIYERV